MHASTSAYISRVFNFANFASFESFAKFTQLKFEPLFCKAHGLHASTKFFQPQQLFTKMETCEIVSAIKYYFFTAKIPSI